MATDERTVGFSWEFLDLIGEWTLRLAAVVALAGLFLTRDPAFALGCLLGAIGDVSLVHGAVVSGRQAVEEGRFADSSAAILLGGRLLFKGGLLVIAMVFPAALDFFGTVVGVLAFDVTLALVGSAIALRNGLTGLGEGR